MNQTKSIPLSGNDVIDNFIKHTLTRKEGRMEFVPYEKFKDVEYIAEGGFSKIYKATWTNGPITNWNDVNQRKGEMTVALKELSNSKDITSNQLNEIKIFNDYVSSREYCKLLDFIINTYYGITQFPTTQNFLIITKYCEYGDLSNFIANNFYNMGWGIKLQILYYNILGLKTIHDANVIHKDYHSGNILIDKDNDDLLIAITSDLGLSKSAIESLNDEDNEVYGIIPYVAPEVLQGKKYTKASDIYSFGMIMWELMTGRRPFWDRNHDTELIIEICDGLRPPITTNVPKGYIELMQSCWHSDPNKRPTAAKLQNDVESILFQEPFNKTKFILSPEIGPRITRSIYKSGSLSAMVKSVESVESTGSLKVQGKIYL